MATTTRLIVGGGAHPGIKRQPMRSAPLLAGLFDGASHNRPFKLTARSMPSRNAIQGRRSLRACRYAATVHRELPVVRDNHDGISSLRPSSLLNTTGIPTLGRRARWCGKGAPPFGGQVSTLNMGLRHNKPFKLTAHAMPSRNAIQGRRS